MARIALALFVGLSVLSACDNAAGSSADSSSDNPNALLPGAGGLAMGGDGSPDAGPTATLTGEVQVPGGLSADGAVVTLTPAGLTATVAAGDYLFAAAPLGPFTLSVTLAGYQPATRTGTLTEAGLTEDPILLEASRPLFAPDSGFSPTWMAFAPDGGPLGPLYAADDSSFWRIATKGSGAVALSTGAPTVKPLGFATDGTPVYFTNYQAPTSGLDGTAVLARGAIASVSITFDNPGPYLIGDDLFFAGAGGSGAGTVQPVQTWSTVSVTSPTPTVIVTQAFAFPPPMPTAFGLVGYTPTSLWGSSCSQGFWATASGKPFLLSPLCAPDWTLPTAIGVSPDGNLAALEFSTSANYATNNTDTWEVEVLSAATGTWLSEQAPSEFPSLTSIVPLSPTTAAEGFGSGALCLDSPAGAAPLQATHVAALPDGSLLALNGALLSHGTATLPFDGSWSQPVVSPAHLVFPGVPMVIDVAAWTSTALEENPQTAQFSADDSELLIVAQDGSLHVITFPTGGPVDAALEGTATLAALTPDGKSVAYAGQDPAGSTGIFLQPAIPPAGIPASATTTDGGTP